MGLHENDEQNLNYPEVSYTSLTDPTFLENPFRIYFSRIADINHSKLIPK